jgi:hypothetical protein
VVQCSEFLDFVGRDFIQRVLVSEGPLCEGYRICGRQRGRKTRNDRERCRQTESTCGWFESSELMILL